MKLQDRAIELLCNAGYLQMGESLNIGSATFTFEYVLWNGEAGFNLVVGSHTHDNLVRKVSALARALDFLGSKASITVVLEADRLDLKSRSALSQLARVLLIGPETLSDDLRVLLPLELERRVVESLDPIEVLRQSLRADRAVLESGLLDGHESEERVRAVLGSYIKEGVTKG